MDFKEKYKKNLAAIPHGTKQEILDLLRKGLSVGEICRKLNMEVLLVSGVICENIESISTLRMEAK